MIEQDLAPFEVRAVVKLKPTRGRRQEDVAGSTAELVMSSQPDMDVILELSRQGALTGVDGQVYRVVEKVASALPETGDFSHQEIQGNGSKFTEMPRENWEEAAERFVAAMEHDVRFGPLLEWPAGAANDSNVILAGGKMCIWLAEWDGKPSHKIRFRLRDTDKFAGFLNLSKEKQFFPLRTADRQTSPWPRRAPMTWAVVRPGGNVPPERLAPTVRARVAYLNKVLAGDQKQGGAAQGIGSGGGGGSSGNAGPMGRMWGPPQDSGLEKLLRDGLVDMK
eukprot:204495-Prorocentrum_minimum.AAC.1